MTGVFRRRDTDRDTQGEGHVTPGAEAGVMLPQAKEGRGSPMTPEAGGEAQDAFRRAPSERA